MSSDRPESLFNSTTFRLSVGYAVLLIIAFTITAAISWGATKSATEREVRERISLEMKAMLTEMKTESMAAAVLQIRSRVSEPGALEYRLVDPAGRLIVGNLDLHQMPEGWGRATLRDRRDGEDEVEEFVTLTQMAPDGSSFTIADDLDKAEGVRGAVVRAFLSVAAPAFALVIGVGVFLSYRTVRRMRALTRAMHEVGKGDLSARAPDRGGDEIARIGAGVNEMVARIDRLVLNIRRVSTDIAHDLRTPLTHVRQDLEAVAKSSDPQAQEAARAAQARIDDMLRVFQAIMRLAEIDAGSARARFVRLDLGGVIERVTDAYHPDVEASGHSLVVTAQPGVTINGDEDLIALCLANLLENAMRHTPAGSAVSVALTVSAAGAVLAVEDQGPGIPPEQHQRVLEPFVRLDASRTTPGAGLGLSIVSAIVRLHGANLQLQDAKPGLRVAITWPV